MRKTTTAAAVVLGIAATTIAAPAQAARDQHGTPGTNSCWGHAMAYTAQKWHGESWLPQSMSGIGGNLRYQNQYGLDQTVADVRSAIEWYCGGGAG